MSKKRNQNKKLNAKKRKGSTRAYARQCTADRITREANERRESAEHFERITGQKIPL